MKKTLAALLVCATVACSAFGLAACGGNHTHTYKWENDAAEHWQVPTCDDTTEEINRGAHDTNGANGSCSVCGYISPEAALKTGFYSFEYSAGDYGTMKRGMRFYDDILYIVNDGGGGTQHYICDYMLEKEDYDYSVWFTAREAGRGEDGLTPAEKHTGKVDYTIKVTDRKDSSINFSFGFDGTYIYTDEVKSVPINDMNYMRFEHDAGKDAAYGGLEVGQNVVNLCKDGDETAYFQILHDGTYADLMGDGMVEGKWTSAKGSDGKVTYTLTPNDATDTGATVVVSADGKSGTYTSNGGTAINLVVPQEKKAIITMTGTTTLDMSGTVMDATLNLYLYDDQSCKLEMTVGPQTNELDTGTYALNQATYGYTFTFVGLGTVECSIANATASKVDYTVTIPADSASGRDAATLTGSLIIPQVVHTLTGSAFSGVVEGTLELLDDGTCKYTLKQSGEVKGNFTGTYTKNSYQIPNSLTINGQTIEISWDTSTGVLSANMTAVSNDVSVTVTCTLPSQA